MAAPDTNTIKILTEHLGFPPISLVDDIINGVNEIMYKCTAALEKYLSAKLETNTRTGDSDEELDEVQVGTAELETLLESSVDKNFDLFELYTLRNVLNIPKDLVSGGWIRLEHYKDMTVISGLGEKLKDTTKQINSLEKDLQFQLMLKKRILKTLGKAKRLLKSLKYYHQALGFLSGGGEISDDARASLRKLSPISESLYFLKSESQGLYEIIKALDSKFETSILGAELVRTERDVYVDTLAYKLLKFYDVNSNSDQTINIKLNRIKDSANQSTSIKRVNNRIHTT